MRLILQNFDIFKELTVSPHHLRYLGCLQGDPTHQPYLIQLIQMPSDYNIDRLRQDAEKVMQLQHPFILQKARLFIERLNSNEYLIINSQINFQLCTLKQLISSCNMNTKALLEIMLKLVNLLEYLHSQRMYLGSISANQIYMLDGKPLLNYLYLPQTFKQLFLMENENSLGERWIAPQTQEKNKVNEKSDIWCLGVLLSQILLGQFSLNQSSYHQFSIHSLANIKQPNIRFLLETMLKTDTLDRASLSQVKEILEVIINGSPLDPKSVVNQLVKQESSIIGLKNLKPGYSIGKYEILRVLRQEKGKMSCLTFDKQSEEERMLKMMEVPKDWLQITLEELQKYYEIKHENLLPITKIASFDVEDSSDVKVVAIISKYYSEGTVEDALQGMAWMTLNQTKNICLQISPALSCLHRQGIIHQNLVNGNIYRKKQKWILGEKLTIFQLCKRAQKYANSSEVPLECPPECIQNQSPDFSSDVWCMAALFLTIHLNQQIKESKFLSYDIKSSDYVDKYLGKRMCQFCEEWLKQATKQHPNQRIDLAQIQAKLANINQKTNAYQLQILREKYQVYQKTEKAQEVSFYDSDEQNTGGIVTDEGRNQDQNDFLIQIKGKVKYPYDVIGRISSKFSNGNRSGNGFLLSKDLVLTCAHNVHNKKIRQDATQIFFIHPEGRFKVLEYYYPKDFQWDNTETRQKDYCIILLERPVKIDKFLNLVIDYDDISEETQIAGYVSLKQEKDYPLCYAKDKINKMKKGFIQHRAPTIPGFSGSPMLIQAFDGFYYVVGIHIGSKNSEQAEQLNCGIHLTMENMKNVLTQARAKTKRSEPFIFISYKNIKLRQPQQPRDDYVPHSEKIQSMQKMLNEEEQKDKQSQEVMSINNQIGNQLLRDAKFLDALVYYERVLCIAVKNKDNIYVALAYHNIGICYDGLKKYKVALEYLFKALKIHKQIFGESHPKVAQSYLNIGNAKFHLGDSSQSLRYYQQAIPIFKQHNQKQQLADALNNIAHIQFLNEEYDIASNNCREALEIYQKLFGKVTPQSLIPLRNLSSCYYLMGRRMESCECFYTCMLNMEILRIPKEHPQYQKILNVLTQLIRSLIRYAAVKKPTKEQLLLVEKILVRLSFGDALLMQVREFLRNMK